MKTPLVSRLKKAARLLTAVVGLGFLLIPSVAVALGVGPGDSAPAVKEAAQSAVCAKVSDLKTSYDQKVGSRLDTLDQNRSSRDTKLKADQDAATQKITTDRANWDKIRADNFAKLEAKAATDSEKTAVQTYEGTVTDAVNTRRAAYDAARTAFQASLANAISNRRSAINGQVTTLQASLNTAFDSAETNCSAQGKGVATRLRSEVKTARQTFGASVKSDDKVSQQITQFQATRKATDQAADQAFKTAMDSARQTLLAAFKGSSADVQ